MPPVAPRTIVTPLRVAPKDRLVFESAYDGAALFEGWSDGGTWRVMLPWPEETRVLQWSQAHLWKEKIAEMEHDVTIGDAHGSLPFIGGWIGYVAYEAAANEESVRARNTSSPEPPLFFAKHRAGVLIDPTGAAFLFAPAGQSRAFASRLRGAAALTQHPCPPRAAHLVTDSLGDGAYARVIERIRASIRDGDVYQVNLTRALSIPGAGDASALYRTLTGSTPPRMSAFLRAPGCTIASASPEVLLRFDRLRGVAETRPIKGTVRRVGNDAMEISALRESAKDAAEHLMIVDVSRNDLGKVAPAGRVSVTDYRRIRTLEYVHHLESTVQATGLRDRSVAEILAALSPAASITGAPKRAAVHMIREIEPVSRGVYCGSIGIIGTHSVEMSVAIRTAIVTASEMRYHAGGGIVWDSRADLEDAETRDKSAAFLRFAGARE